MGFLPGSSATILNILGGPAGFSPAVQRLNTRIAGASPLTQSIEGKPAPTGDAFSQLVRKIQPRKKRKRRKPTAASLFQQAPTAKTPRGLIFTPRS